MGEREHVETRLLLVRHGQSTWNAEGRWQGHSDPPLSPLGELQASAGAATVTELGITAVFSSDLLRARRTAELLAPPEIVVVVEPALKERNVGEWEGLTRGEIDAQFPGMLDARESPPGFESDESLVGRVLPALETIASGLAARTSVLVVTHGGVIRSLERRLGAPSAPVPNLAGRWVVIAGADLVLGDREVLIDADDATLTVPTEE
ncbi:MAG: histidine phosphatase family protein [Acidimicrobiia bacterium]